MARQEKYYIRFCDINDVQYRVSIQVEGFAGTAVELTAADDPVQLNEDNDSDLFKAVKTWNGYIRVVCTFAQLLDILPDNFTSHKVVITRGSSTLPFFVGYLKPEQYNVKFSPVENIYELPLVCALGVLNCIDYKPVSGNMTFAAGISQILHMSFGSTDLEGVVCNSVATYSSQMGDLPSYFNSFSFYKINNDYDPQKEETYDNGRLEPEYKALEALEQICTFWGWQVRYYKGRIYLNSPDMQIESQKPPIFYTFANFATLTSESSVTTYNKDFLEDEFVLSNAHINILPNARKVTVEVIKKEDEPVKYQLSYLPYSTTIGIHVSGDNTYAKNEYLGTETQPILGDNKCWIIDQNGNITASTISATVVVYSADAGLYNAKTWEYPSWEDLGTGDPYIDESGGDAASLSLCRLDNWATQDTPDHTKYEWKYYIPLGYFVNASQYWFSYPLARFRTNFYMSMASMQTMVLKAKVHLASWWYTSTSEYDNGNDWQWSGSQITGVKYSTVRAIIRFGNYYWTGTEWTDRFPAYPLEIPFGDPVKARYVVENHEDATTNASGDGALLKDYVSMTKEAEGYRIPIPPHMDDVDIEITFYAQGPNDRSIARHTNKQLIWISEPELEYINEEYKDIKYESYTGKDSDREESVKSLFHVELKGSGKNTTVLDPQLGVAQKYWYSLSASYGLDDPLSVLVYRMNKFYSTPKITREFKYVESNEITPVDFVHYGQNSEVHSPISYSFDLKNAFSVIKLINLNYDL